VDALKELKSFPSGVVTPPPSKSLSHRAVICAALASLAGGESTIENLGFSDDIDATLSCVRTLLGAGPKPGGAFGRIQTKKSVRGAITTVGCGESGSTLRFMLPVAALGPERVVFTGKGRLLTRPLGVYAEIFKAAGAEFIQETDKVTVKGPLRSGEYAVPGDVSSQFVSGLLLALPLLDGDSSIRMSSPLESSGYVDMTIDVMRHFGVEAEPKGELYLIKGNQRYCPARCRVENDYSQAAFFLVSAALGRDVKVSGLDRESVQGDRAILDVLGEAGALINWDDGVVSVRANRLSPVTVDAREIPDLVPPIAALCCFCDGTSRILNAGRLRLKESDRLHALAAELGKLGADIVEGEDCLEITGRESLTGGDADARGDHRIAMAIAAAAVRCRGRVRLSGWRNVAKSYPDFWRDFETAED
jgi:3-phosphoshikimate 1-carboxyvinyltransferase